MTGAGQGIGDLVKGLLKGPMQLILNIVLCVLIGAIILGLLYIAVRRLLFKTKGLLIRQKHSFDLPSLENAPEELLENGKSFSSSRNFMNSIWNSIKSKSRNLVHKIYGDEIAETFTDSEKVKTKVPTAENEDEDFELALVTEI